MIQNILYSLSKSDIFTSKIVISGEESTQQSWLSFCIQNDIQATEMYAISDMESFQTILHIYHDDTNYVAYSDQKARDIYMALAKMGLKINYINNTKNNLSNEQVSMVINKLQKENEQIVSSHKLDDTTISSINKIISDIDTIYATYPDLVSESEGSTYQTIKNKLNNILDNNADDVNIQDTLKEAISWMQSIENQSLEQDLQKETSIATQEISKSYSTIHSIKSNILKNMYYKYIYKQDNEESSGIDVTQIVSYISNIIACSVIILCLGYAIYYHIYHDMYILQLLFKLGRIGLTSYMIKNMYKMDLGIFGALLIIGVSSISYYMMTIYMALR